MARRRQRLLLLMLSMLSVALSELTTEDTDYQEYDEPVPVSVSVSLSGPVPSAGYTVKADAEPEEQLQADNEILKTRDVDRVAGEFRTSLERVRAKHKQMDIVFLIDASSSVGRANFEAEIRFVKKLLGDFNVSFNYTRVSLVTFSSRKKIVRHIDQVGQSVEQNDKCLLLNYQIPTIAFSGGGTYTYGALREAEAIFGRARPDSRKLVFLVTDGFSNGRDPVPVADALKRDRSATIYSIGVRSGNAAELQSIASSPTESHRYLLDSFEQFEMLARKALHSDYRGGGGNVAVNDSALCDVLCEGLPPSLVPEVPLPPGGCCDPMATCGCSVTSGHYACSCRPGYFGSGLRGHCLPCPNGTYWVAGGQCRNCPDVQHVTVRVAATSARDCTCKDGFRAGDDDGRCEIITCPALTPPENGYFVKHPATCAQVMNAACGARCQSGYQLTGSSIRLCEESGVWSGEEAKCVLKTCPSLTIPYYGLAVCRNPDLGLYYDYSPRNKSFLVNYSATAERLTEPMPIDTECTFKCGHGFYLIGSNTRSCLPLSKWDGLQTACKQILCPTLPAVPFGAYDPADCSEGKSAHGTNCTLVCQFGFELKGGPATKSCGGKRTGVWSQKTKTPRCVDVAPPLLLCPNNYTVALHDDHEYALVQRLNAPYVHDNGENVTYWSKPAVRPEAGTRLYVGVHQFAYVAVDAFKNKARCNFSVTVVDRTPPVLDGCHDVTVRRPDPATVVEWDEPTVYDNAQGSLVLTRNVSFGPLTPGVHPVLYRAVDGADNVAECVVRVTVVAPVCEPELDAPEHGWTVCARNETHAWCDVTCVSGHALHDGEAGDTLRLVCEHRTAEWNGTVPECAPVAQPEGVEEILTIELGTDVGVLCGDGEAREDVEGVLVDGLRQQLCGDPPAPGCTITSEIPACGDGKRERTRYQIVRRDVGGQRFRAADQTTIKVSVYTKLSKRLGLWRPDGKRSDNIKRVKQELSTISENERLRRRLTELSIDLSALRLDERIRCPVGSVAKRLLCVQCPRGTFHNVTGGSGSGSGTCQPCPVGTYGGRTGQTECVACPEHQSTRKANSKHGTECKPQCPPGTVAKLKLMKREGGPRYHKSLMPFCRKCEPGEYQGLYDRIQCERCPPGYVSPRGSTAVSDCVPRRWQPCAAEPPVCGSHGHCVPEPVQDYLYSCTCEDGYVGSHCERALDGCASAPCYNGGQCRVVNGTGYECQCVAPYAGPLCEEFRDPCGDPAASCRNGGTCSESGGRAVCECPGGFSGDRCDQSRDFCSPNPCEAGGICENLPDGGFVCACSGGRIGRRCHLQPCDYLPCPKGAVCVNDGHTEAASFRCACPKGLKGDNCTEVDDPCNRDPCRNNGQCRPVRLRNPADPIGVHLTANNDDEYLAVACDCPPYFYGERCETLVRPDFVMEFPQAGVTDHVRIAGPTGNLTAIAFCGWIETRDDFNYGSVVSYATRRKDNAFTLTDYSGLVLYVDGNHVVTNVRVNDGTWHFVCASWMSERGFYEIFLDGELHTTGYNLSSGAVIEEEGLFVIGQEQDTYGGDFSASESFVGRLAYVDLWGRALAGHEVRELYRNCEPYQGDLIRWTDLKSKTVGDVKVRASGFCRECERNLTLTNGDIEYVENRAVMRCHEGYELHGPTEVTCLRTSAWSAGTSFCKLIRCRSLTNSILNGRVVMSKTSYGGVARFSCDVGFYLVGPESVRCTADGVWSADPPECISTVKCEPLEVSGIGTHIIYASDRGILSEPVDRYAVGILAEVKCGENHTLTGENLLTCLDHGQWDVDVPTCLANDALPTSPVPNIIRVNRRPDVRFWKQLKKYLFYSCTPDDPLDLSTFCMEPYANDTDFGDLSAFALAEDINQYEDIDTKLLDFLLRTTVPDPELQLPQLVSYILYGTVGPVSTVNRLPLAEENAYRFVICLFIDIILMDHELNYDDELLLDLSAEENKNAKIKNLLKNVVQPIYQRYLRYEGDRQPAESESVRKQCRLAAIPDPPIDSRVVAVESDSDEARRADLRIEKLRKSPIMMEIGDKVRYNCNPGFTMRGSGYAECKPEGVWSYFDSFCEGVLCEDPPISDNMLLAAGSIDLHYYYDDEIEYQCAEGYIMQGHPIIKCMLDGRWTPIVARCTRISCGKPKLSLAAKIIAGSSFSLGDQLKVLCKDKRTIEIRCQPTGSWTPADDC